MVNRRLFLPLLLMLAFLGGSAAYADQITLTEAFSDPFPAWKTGWLAQNSNIQNYYEVRNGCYGVDCRGNNPLGLWLDDGDAILLGDAAVDILFLPSFGLTATAFAIDIAAYNSPISLIVFDSLYNVLLDTPITGASGPLYLQSSYSHYSVTSTTGIGGFTLVGVGTEGNTSVDNLTVTQEATPVPDAGSSLLLLGMGLAGLRAWRKR